MKSNPTHEINNRSMPPGKIIPELVYDDLDEAVAWLCRTFRFRERLRIGDHRSQLTLDGGSLIAVQNPDQSTSMVDGPGKIDNLARRRDHLVMVQVDDLVHHYEHAVQCGAKIINPPTDYPYGERQYTVEDIGGHVWTFTQSIADVDPGEWGGELLIDNEGAN